MEEEHTEMTEKKWDISHRDNRHSRRPQHSHITSKNQTNRWQPFTKTFTERIGVVRDIHHRDTSGFIYTAMVRPYIRYRQTDKNRAERKPRILPVCKNLRKNVIVPVPDSAWIPLIKRPPWHSPKIKWHDLRGRLWSLQVLEPSYILLGTWLDVSLQI